MVSTTIIHPQSYVGMKGHIQVPIAALSRDQMNTRAKDIFHSCLKYFNFDFTQIVSKGRKGDAVYCRQIMCYMMRILTNLKDGEIAEYVNRDRTTVIHSIEVITGFLKVKDPEYVQVDIDTIKSML